MRELTIHAGQSRPDGGCNACTDNPISPDGIEPDYRVWLLRVRTAEVRFCDACLLALHDALADGPSPLAVAALFPKRPR
jgi:hypothetical protein